MAELNAVAGSSASVDVAPVASAKPLVTIVVCETCREATTDAQTAISEQIRPGSALAASTEAAATDASGVVVRRVNCLSNCKRGLSAAILGPTQWTYVFGDLKADSGADLVVGALLLANSDDGLMPFRPRPEALKRGMIARIPNYKNLLTSKEAP